MKTLNFRLKKRGDVLKKDDRMAFERHKVSVETLMTAIVKLKEFIEEKKFSNGDDDKAISNGPKELN